MWRMKRGGRCMFFKDWYFWVDTVNYYDLLLLVYLQKGLCLVGKRPEAESNLMSQSSYILWNILKVLDNEGCSSEELSCWIWYKTLLTRCLISHRLYEFPKKQVSVDTKSALTWCRHVLDNPSPEMEAACRLLTNKLDQSKQATQTHSLYCKHFVTYL